MGKIITGFQAGGMVAYTAVQVPTLQNKLRPTLLAPPIKGSSSDDGTNGIDYDFQKSKFIETGTKAFVGAANDKLKALDNEIISDGALEKYGYQKLASMILDRHSLYAEYKGSGIELDARRKTLESYTKDNSGGYIYNKDGNVLIHDDKGLHYVNQADAVGVDKVAPYELNGYLDNEMYISKDSKDPIQSIYDNSMSFFNGLLLTNSNEESEKVVTKQANDLSDIQLVLNEVPLTGGGSKKIGTEVSFVIDGKTLKLDMDEMKVMDSRMLPYFGNASVFKGNQLTGLREIHNMYGKLDDKVKYNYKGRAIDALDKDNLFNTTAEQFKTKLGDDLYTDENIGIYIDKVLLEGASFAKSKDEVMGVLNSDDQIKAYLENDGILDQVNAKLNFNEKNDGYSGTLTKDEFSELKQKRINNLAFKYYKQDFITKLTSGYSNKFKPNKEANGTGDRVPDVDVFSSYNFAKTIEKSNVIEFQSGYLNENPLIDKNVSITFKDNYNLGNNNKVVDLLDYGKLSKAGYSDNPFKFSSTTTSIKSLNGSTVDSDIISDGVPVGDVNIGIVTSVDDEGGDSHNVYSDEFRPVVMYMAYYNEAKKGAFKDAFSPNLIDIKSGITNDVLKSLFSDAMDLRSGMNNSSSRYFNYDKEKNKFSLTADFEDKPAYIKVIDDLNTKNANGLTGADIDIKNIVDSVNEYYNDNEELESFGSIKDAYRKFINSEASLDIHDGTEGISEKESDAYIKAFGDFLNLDFKTEDVVKTSVYVVPSIKDVISHGGMSTSDPRLGLSNMGLVSNEDLDLGNLVNSDSDDDVIVQKKFQKLHESVIKFGKDVETNLKKLKGLCKYENDDLTSRRTYACDVVEWYEKVYLEYSGKNWSILNFMNGEELDKFDQYKSFIKNAAPIVNKLIVTAEINNAHTQVAKEQYERGTALKDDENKRTKNRLNQNITLVESKKTGYQFFNN